MLRYMIKCNSKFCLPKNSRTLQSSAAFRTVEKDDEKKEKLDKNRWKTEIEDEHPFSRTYRVMSKQMRQIKNNILFWREPRPVDADEWGVDSQNFPSHIDVAIVGNGAIANSIAYWLTKSGDESFSVVVIENDKANIATSPVLSAIGQRMQYTLEENVELSLYSSQFIREVNSHLDIDYQPAVELNYHPHGCLNLATEAGAEQLVFNSQMQNSKGAKNVILTATELKSKFPWLNTENIALGCLGLEKEGWYDPDILIKAMKNKAISLGAQYVTGNVHEFIFSKTPNVAISSEYKEELYRKLNHVVVENANGEKQVIQFALIIIAAGHESTAIVEKAKIGMCSGILSVPLPIECRKRYAYSISAPEGPGLNTPCTIDPSGFYFKRYGLANNYIVGHIPQSIQDEPYINDSNVDPTYFFDKIWPLLANRVPSFENVKINSSHATFCDYNTYDDNGVIGHHPFYSNMLFATGFGMNSIQHSPAIGRAISELIIKTGFRTIDLTRFGFDRFITEQPQLEVKIA